MSRCNSSLAILALLAALAVASIGCESKDGGSGAGAADPALVEKGKSVYMANCIACHNSDPKQAGTLGPEIWGANEALLKARVLTATYPQGYTPKRPTQLMQPLPQLEKDLPALHAFLNAK